MSVFNLKIMTLYNIANEFLVCYSILAFCCLIKLIWLIKFLQNQNYLPSFEYLNVRYFYSFSFSFSIVSSRIHFLVAISVLIRKIPRFSMPLLIPWWFAILCFWSNSIFRSRNNDNTAINAQDFEWNCNFHWISTNVLLSEEFRNFVKHDSIHDSYRSTQRTIVQMNVTLTCRDRNIFMSCMFRIVSASTNSHKRLGIILGQSALIEHMLYTTVSRRFLIERRKKIEKDVWVDLIVHEYINKDWEMCSRVERSTDRRRSVTVSTVDHWTKLAPKKGTMLGLTATACYGFIQGTHRYAFHGRRSRGRNTPMTLMKEEKTIKNQDARLHCFVLVVRPTDIRHVEQCVG